MAALAQTNPASSGSSGRSFDRLGRLPRTLARAAQLEALARNRREHAETSSRGVTESRRAATMAHERGPSWSRPSGSVSNRRPSPYSRVPCEAARARARANVCVAARCRQHAARRRPAGDTKTTDGVGFHRFEERRRGFARQQLRQDRGVHETAHDGFVGIDGRPSRLRGRSARSSRPGTLRLRSGRARAPSVWKMVPACSRYRSAARGCPPCAARRPSARWLSAA